MHGEGSTAGEHKRNQAVTHKLFRIHAVAAHLVHVHGLVGRANEVDSLAAERLVIAVREVQARGAIGIDIFAFLQNE